MSGSPRTEVRRAADRFRTRLPWLDSRHSFSFGRHYDPANTAHGLLLAHNEDVVQPGTGFAAHPHREMEIVTWVLQGALTHADSEGHRGVVRPGLAQRMSAGTGIEHSETNEAPEPVHLVQMWVPPDRSGTAPGYEQREVDQGLLAAGLVPVASGLARHRGLAAVRIGNRSAALHAARLTVGQGVTLPDAPYGHVFVARGVVDLEQTGPLRQGDAVRLTATRGHRLTATEPAEVLVWEMHAALGA